MIEFLMILAIIVAIIITMISISLIYTREEEQEDFLNEEHEYF